MTAHAPPLFAADLSRAPIGLQVPIRVRQGRDASEVHEVIGQHVGAGLVLHLDPDTDPHSTEHPLTWTVSDGLTGLRVAFSMDPLHAIHQAYQRLVLERGRPSDLLGSVQDAVRAILVRVRRDLPAGLRQPPGDRPC